MIKAFLAQKRASGLSKNSVRLIRSTLSVMLSDAVDDGIILVNPALHLGRGHRGRTDSVTQGDRQRTIRPMSRDQLLAFLASAHEHSHRYAPLFLLLAHTGLRPGEAFALQWEDLDLTGLQINVGRALSAGRIETTKTGLARTVDMSERLARTLKRLRVERKQEALEHGWAEMPRWVFSTEAGTWLDESKVRKVFGQLLKKAGLSSFRVYDLRHTFASLLLAQGVPITYVSAQLGHSRPTTTLQWYAHWLPGARERYVDGLTGLDTETRGHRFGTKSKSGTPSTSEVPDSIGGPWRTRTSDPLIKSQLLYQLS